MLDHIEILVEHGFALHWLHNRAKRPIGNDWSEKPVMTIDQLRTSYRDGNNIGVRLGQPSKVSDHYLQVIDLDIRKPEKAAEAHAALRKLFPGCGEFPCVRSGSGGESRHFYFLCDKPFASKKLAHSEEFFKEFDPSKQREVKHWEWEIELFGTGKQVVLPPSIHPDTGEPYAWLREFDFELLEIGVGPFVTSDDMPDGTHIERTSESGDDEDDLLSMVRTPPMGLNLDEIRDMVFALPKDEWCEDRKGWIDVGMAIHHETGGSDAGFDIWCDFSKQSEKFDLKDARYQWGSFSDDRSDAKTMGSIKKVLRESGEEFLQCKQKLELAGNYRQAMQIAAKYNLTGIEIDTIMPVLVKFAKDDGMVAKEATIKRSLKEMRAEYEEKHDRGRRKSLEDWLADETLRVFWDGGDHLKRMGKAFWVFDSGMWRPLEEEVVKNRVHSLVCRVLKADAEEGGSLQALLDESGRTDTMSSLVNSVASVVATMSASDGREDPLGLCQLHVPSVMNCHNGELWFQNGDLKFIDHDPDHMLTNQLGCEYDPLAECPEWDKALQRIFRDNPDPDEMIRHLHEFMGYIVQPQRNFAAWGLFYGKGSNGKSFVASVLQQIAGRHSWVAKQIAGFGQNNNHAEAGLVGKLLLVDDDYDKGALLPDGQLKKMSEAKAMTANPKGSAEFNFVCRATPLILANQWPKTKDISYGLERRVLVFDFNSTITEEERDLKLLERVIHNELPGILNHLIDGWMRLDKRGRFLEPLSCRRAKEAWMSRRNSMAVFVSDCLEITGEETDQVTGAELWSCFQNWAAGDNFNRYGRNSLYEEIGCMPGVVSLKPGNVRTFRGVKIKYNPSPLDDVDLEDDDLEDDADAMI